MKKEIIREISVHPRPWVEGADIYRRWQDNPEARVAPVQDGWAEYQPALPAGAAPRVIPPAAEEVGRRTAADLDTRETPPEDFWLIEGTATGNRLKPQSEIGDTRWHGVRLLGMRPVGRRCGCEMVRDPAMRSLRGELHDRR